MSENLIEPKKIEDLLRENLEYSKKILRAAEKTRHYILIGQILGFIKLLLIVIPIILGLIYLPPLFKGLMVGYEELLTNFSQGEIIELLPKDLLPDKFLPKE